jgi:hypothetical protein
MRIEEVEIENYKVFHQRQRLSFSPGFNLLVGANNSGKTTVLDVLDLNPGLNDPHRSLTTIPEYGGETPPHSQYEIALATRFEELRSLVGWNQIYLPISAGVVNERDRVNNYVRQFAETNAAFKFRARFQNGICNFKVLADDLVGGSFDSANGNAAPAAILQYTTPTGSPSVSSGSLGGTHAYATSYPTAYAKRIYRFSAQRRPGAEIGAQNDGSLDREASNLPFCINYLQSNDSYGHGILCKLVNRVFPSIKWIEAPPTGGMFRLRCLPCDPSTRRDDLAIPIAKMGTGVGNVIAMLYVALTSRHPQVIAIDEPNAFLHPRALRELLSILETDGAMHQYVMTAHSPDVITAVNLSSMTLLDFNGASTVAKRVSELGLFELRGELADLGIRITDLHARDRVFWVEGQTEELLMPDLLRHSCPEVAASTAVLRVERTGTFSRKGVEPTEVARLYQRLSTSSALVPPMVCILLDAEGRPHEQRERIARESGMLLRFLPRKMIECYFLHPEAIAAQLNALGCTASDEVVAQTLTSSLSTELTSATIAEADGARVLGDVFSKVSDAKVEFRKTRDVPALAAWIIRHDPDSLIELRLALREIFHLGAG